jgi:hypothetical protein
MKNRIKSIMPNSITGLERVKWQIAQERLWQDCAGSDTVAADQPGDCVVRGGDKKTVIVSTTPAEVMYICDFAAFSSKSYT